MITLRTRDGRGRIIASGESSSARSTDVKGGATGIRWSQRVQKVQEDDNEIQLIKDDRHPLTGPIEESDLEDGKSERKDHVIHNDGPSNAFVCSTSEKWHQNITKPLT